MNIDSATFIFGFAFLTLAGIIFYCAAELLRRRVAQATTVLLPEQENLKAICEDIVHLDLESKIRIVQAAMGHTVDFVVSVDSVNASIKGCAVSGADLSAMMQNDVSVG